MSVSEQNEIDDLKSLDSQAVSSIYDRYFSDIYRFVRFRLNDDDIAEDIASDVFLRLIEASQTGRGPQTNIKAWLLATASHIVIDHLRKSYRRPESELPETLSDGKPDFSSEFEKQERDLRLKSAINTLTEEQQYVINLRFDLGYSLEETANLMKKNVNSVKQLQFRAIAALNRAIGELI